MKKTILFFITLIIAINTIYGQNSYWNFVSDDDEIELSESVKIEIEIAVFEALFNNNASMIKENASYYYISIEDSSNTILPKVLKAFNNNNPQVKSIEEYYTLSSEEQKNIKFLSFNIGHIKAGKRKAVVSCGYYEANLSSSINSVLLIKRFGRWKVIKNEIIVIS